MHFFSRLEVGRANTILTTSNGVFNTVKPKQTKANQTKTNQNEFKNTSTKKMKDSRTTTIPIMAAAVMTTNNNNKGKKKKKKKKRINTSSTTGSSSSMLTTITVVVVGLLRRNYILLFLLVLAIIQNIYLLSSKTTNFDNNNDRSATVVQNNNAIGIELAKEHFSIQQQQQQQRSTTLTTTENNGDNNSDNNGDDVLDEEEDEEFRIEENNNKNKNRKGRKRRWGKDDNKEDDDSVNKLLLYELWNHTTNTIHIPNALRPSFANTATATATATRGGSNGSSPDDKHQVLLTSLEILQNVLHNKEKEREYLAVDNYIQRNFSLSITETIPQCLIPNKDATRRLANEYMKLLVQPQQRPNLLPVLNVGMPKMGTTTLADYFDCAGYYATHDKVGNKYFGKNQNYIRTQNTGPQKGDIHEGVELFRRAKQHKMQQHSGTNNNSTTLFKLLDYNKERVKKSIDVHCQMDTNRVEGWYPQIKLLDELHEEQPNSTFVLIFRPLKDWFNSIHHWPGIKERMSKFTMPGLVLTKQQQIDVQKVRNWHVNAKEFSLLSKSSKEEFIQQYKKQNPELYRLKITKDAKNAAKRAAKMMKKNPKTSKSEKILDDEPSLLLYPILKPSEPEPVNEIQLGRWWCSHVNHIRDYVKQYPSHKLIELDLYDTKTSSDVLDDIFQKQKHEDGDGDSNGNEEKESCWGHANVNKKAATTT